LVRLAMQNKKTNYTVIFIPEGSARTFSVHIHRNIVYSLIIFLLIFIVGFILLLVKSGEIAIKLQLVYLLTNENKQLKEENKKMTYIADKIDGIEQLGRYLQRIARSSGVDLKREQLTANSSPKSGESMFSKDNMDEMLDSIRMLSGGNSRKKGKRGAAGELYLNSQPNIQPVFEGWITRRFILEANDTEQTHNGTDYAATQGTLVRATAPGIVENVCNDRYFGLMLTIKHGNGISTRYGHCSQILVAKEDHVERGQTIALVGNTGRSSAPHLHYEVLKDGKNVDPAKYIYGNEEK
jgi:murein DD-endopeptidase MepM/ murein hydrolase activator NlpD